VARPLAGRAETADVAVAGGRVLAIGERAEAPPGATEVDASGLWLLPGWIDLQVNDLAWLSSGPKDPEEHAARVAEVLEVQARGGVTGLVLATVASPVEDLLLYLRGIRLAMERRRPPAGGALLGALVEGTFLNPACCGAHNPAWVEAPDAGLLEKLLETGAVRIVNIAPEISPDAVACIRKASDRGVVVGVGHAKPHARALREAVAVGARYAIHLGNGPTGSSLKAFEDGGMLEECLRNDGVTIGVILDGVHIHPEIARDWIARKGLARTIAVSDAAFATGVPPGEFEVFGIRGALSEDGRYLRVVRPGAPRTPGAERSSDFGPLFGSVATLRDVFENALRLLAREMPGVWHRAHPALPFEEAVLGAARLASSNAAELLGERDRGSIEPGFRGDLVLARISGRPEEARVEVEATWVA
ncbi:MAG: amidohydrolase family protein, partial [Planctomycetota bacterium]